jgi:SMI1 / KNR4 family (SUKH-1)
MGKINTPYGTTSADTIQRLEARAGISLPSDYKAFLLESNGGHPNPDEFVVPGWLGESSAVHRLLGIHDGPNGNLETYIVRYRDRLQRGFIPIGIDPGGNLLTLSLEGANRGSIYFWDHEDELDDEGLSRTDMSNMFELATNIGEFIESLKPPPEATTHP